jgi:hypothetical protein
MENWKNNLIWCAILAVAFAYIESSVVVYLRILYYPEGFRFPVEEMPLTLFLTEVGREIATIVVLLVLSFLVAQKLKFRVFLFLYCFGIWDLCYYLWLKVLVGWPVTILDWDILFLIPVPWVAPVLSPVLISLFFIAAAVVVNHLESRGGSVSFHRVDWLLEILAALIIVCSYFWETGSVFHKTIPERYPWWLWGTGIVLALSIFIRRMIQSRKASPA